MTSPRKPGFVLPAAVTLAVLLALYVGAYYLLVWPPASPFISFSFTEPFYGRDKETAWEQGGRSSRTGRFFAPMHWVDRRIRPHVWEPSE